LLKRNKFKRGFAANLPCSKALIAPVKLDTQGLLCELRVGGSDLEGWRRVEIVVSVPEIAVSFSCTIQTFDFEDLRDKLIDMHNGKTSTMEWGNLEKNIFLSLEQNNLGNIVGTYKFSPNVISVGPTLSGPFSADQSYIYNWVTQLNTEVGFGS